MSRSLRVALDARYLAGPRGGVAYTVENLLREFVRLEPGISLHLVVRPGHALPDLGAARVSVAACDYETPGLREMYLFSRRVRLDGWPVYHAPHNFLPRGVGTRTVLTVHDVMWLQSRDNIVRDPLQRLAVGWFYDTYLPDSIRRADRVIAVSRATRDALVGFVPEARGKTVVIPNGRDPYFEPRPPAEVAGLTRAIVPDGCRVVLAIGNGSPHKNHYRAVQAFLRAFGGRPEWRMVLVRRFERRDGPMAALLESSEARRQVIVLPYVARDVVRALYCRARIFFFPSWVEGFGLPILEAMACRTPVLTANVSAPAEVAGEAALAVDPFDVGALADGLRRLDADEALREELIGRGAERIRAFDWTESARQTLEVYRELGAGAG
ncbi:MAG: glycosyltransferase family 4 protein [Deltaproteobacteria bacterium]|nr:glycosyltransferase family 4 protein [Deltaproteobacteria bacterium]